MADIMRVKATSSGFSGGPGFSQFYFGVAVPPVNDPAAVLACNRVRDAFTAARNLFPGSWSITVDADVDVVDPESGDLTGSLSGATSTVTGNAGAGSDYGPSPSGLLVNYQTAGVVNSKHVRGRTFLVPVASNTLGTGGAPSTAARALATAFGVAMRDAGATDCVFGVWSRPVDAAHAKPSSPERDGSFWGATGSSVPNEFIVLRSRRD